MKLSILGESWSRKMGSDGALTQDRAAIGTRDYLSPEMVKLAFKATPRRPSTLGRKPLPRFKYLKSGTQWTKDPEVLVHAVLKHHDKLDWTDLWGEIYPELLRYKQQDDRFEIPNEEDVLNSLFNLVKRDVVKMSGGSSPRFGLSS